MSAAPVIHAATGSDRKALLLRAATLTGPEALAAWQAWRSDESLESLEPDAQWLLPLLYCNLRQAGVAQESLRRYANVYRHHWYKNQLLLRAVGDALAGTQGILLLGGAALAAGWYGHLGARPIERVSLDCAAPGAAARRLAAAGWQASASGFFTSAVGQRIELCASPPRADALRARARPVRLGRAQLLVLSALDQLVFVLAAGEDWDRRSRLWWLADAGLLLRQLGAGPRTALPGRARELGREAAARENWRRLCAALELREAGWP